MSQVLRQKTLEAILGNSDPEFFKSQVPGFINANLKEAYGKRPYQQEGFGRFIYYWNEYRQQEATKTPIQLLYHMATGSGKTLMMAGLTIYLYERGYRNFLFFVNSSNIINKTRDNFFNTRSSKYLFTDTVSILDKQIRIKEVANFQAANQDDINIVFSTIQGLHSKLNSPRENSLSYDDFEDQKIVLISDEAHHINAETKKGHELNAAEKEAIISWEGTVNRIFNANPENVLLEFTATADLSVPEIQNKYSNKLLFDYSLKQFRQDGYSKEVKVLQADLSPFERALQAVLLSQYRRKIFEKHKKLIKPVILFKSKTIKESSTFFEEFADSIKRLKWSDLEKIKHGNPEKAIKNVFQYFEANNISLENLITELKEDFSADKLISVNSKEESEQKQLAVNSLEDESNAYRAVFAVDKLNEGWDVLNLFDIVRLYNTRDAAAGKPGKTTMAEAQLIGRGARYCPFQISKDQAFFERKFDDEPDHELRICEELYYHSAYNPKYIQELNTALVEIGIKSRESHAQLGKKSKAINGMAVKASPDQDLGEQGQQTDKYRAANGLPLALMEKPFKVNLKTGYVQSSLAFGNTQTAVLEKNEIQEKRSPQEIQTRHYLLGDFGEHVLRKAVNKLEFYQFSRLQKRFPKLNSITEFISSDHYLGRVKVEVRGLPEQITKLETTDKLEAALIVLERISIALSEDMREFKGSN